jgi:hypothetical protein
VHSRNVAAGLGLALALVCVLSGLHPASAARRQTPPPIFVGGQLIRQPAILEHGHLLVPVRGIFEALHASVTYTPPRIVVVRKYETVVAGLEIDRKHAVIYNRPRTLSVAPIRRRGHVYVPLRAVAEIAGAVVTYSKRPRLVDIRMPNDELVVAPQRPAEGAVVPPDDGPPLWALGAIGGVVAAFLLECIRRVWVQLRMRRMRRVRRFALRSRRLSAARHLAYTTGLRDQHHVGEIGKQPGVDDAVNRA